MSKDAAIVLSFAGRPVAVVDGDIRYVSIDHLGAPILLTSGTTAVIWDGGFEPFGADYADALSTGVFLRHPGQWEDAGWSTYLPNNVLYNLHRWYEPGIGKYTRSDPLLLMTLRPNALTQDAYLYARSRPTVLSDPLGLCVLDPKMERCLIFIFGESVAGVKIKSKLRPNSRWAATTRRNRIVLYTGCAEFFDNPAVVLEEFYHVLRQWNRGRMTRLSYAKEFLRDGYQGNKFELEAWTFVEWQLRDFEGCLECPDSVPADIGPGGVSFSGYPQ
jgi:RHS repeat-associated protein